MHGPLNVKFVEHMEVVYDHPLAVFFIFIAYKIVKEIGIMFFTGRDIKESSKL